jgi:hypothetical protein
MLRNKDLLKKYDLSSVTSVFTGAAPLGAETSKELQDLFPHWAIRQGYGKFCSLSNIFLILLFLLKYADNKRND